MAFKTVNQTNFTSNSPEEMFHDIRPKNIEGALAQQADIWRTYQREASKKPDVAIKMPTGSGKTLVGLVLGEWRRRKYQEQVVYLCPTNQLVNQVVDQANNYYGLDVVGFTGPAKNYDNVARAAYRRKDKIAITTYHALFNTNPFFDSPNIIILDDAHSAENSIGQMWSLEINHQSPNNLFTTLINLFEMECPYIDLSRTKKQLDIDAAGWVEKLPSNAFFNLQESIRSLIDSYHDDDSIRYVWQLLRDYLHACHCYISKNKILIRPIIPPTFTHKPFCEATQRIYMSATLGMGGDLERVTGTDNIYRLNPKSTSDSQAIGRRFFVFPDIANDAEPKNLIPKSLDIFKRAIFISSSKKAASERTRELAKVNIDKIFTADMLANNKNMFAISESAVAVIANRYDGMDFPGDVCRLLFLEGFPKATNLQERFIVSKLGSGSLYNDRIQTRITQAVGRCTRANSDYSVVCVIGEEWISYLLSKDNLKYLHPEIQAEIEFGDHNSITLEDILENLKAFHAQNSDWRVANNAIVQLRDAKQQEIQEEAKDLEKAVQYELKYIRAIWEKDFLTAHQYSTEVLAVLAHPKLKGYRAFWNYLAGSSLLLANAAGHTSDSTKSQNYFEQAKKATGGVSWLVDLASFSNVESPAEDAYDIALTRMIESLEASLWKMGVTHPKKFNQKRDSILMNLNQDNADSFENGQLELGRLLGFECGNTEHNAAPDPWWVIDKTCCIVFEDHTESTNDQLGVNKARQVATHDNWIRANVQGLDPSAEIIKVLVTPAQKEVHGSSVHLHDVYLLTPDEFREWAKHILTVLESLRIGLSKEGDLTWRENAKKVLINKDLTPKSIAKFLKKQNAANAISSAN
ncbi:MAG: DEAD/DEAH box helicase [Chloroflexota bacterium]